MAGSVFARTAAQARSVGLSGDVLKSMLKNTIPPTAALWVIQSTTLYDDFDTIGYLPIIITVIEAPMLPRVPFLKTMVFTCILNCVMACVGLLAGYCSTQARIHTTPQGQPLSAYNSSASVVSAIWLFFSVWALQTFRAYQPQHLTSVIVCTIFTVVSIVVSTRLTDMDSVIDLILQLLESFFLAHGFCTATSLLVFPKTSRAVVLDGIQKFLVSAKSTASREKAFLDVLGTTLSQDHSEEDLTTNNSSESSQPSQKPSLFSTFASAKTARTALSQDFAKLEVDLALAKNDIGWSGLSAADLKQTIRHFRSLMLSLRGIIVVGALFKSICEWRKWDLHFDDNEDLSEKRSTLPHEDAVEQQEWKDIFQHSALLFTDVEQLILDGLDHTAICLKQSDAFQFAYILRCLGIGAAESDPENSRHHQPGGRHFVSHFIERIRNLNKRTGSMLISWRDHEDLTRTETKEASFQRILSHEYRPNVAKYQDRYYREQQQLLVILYIENLLRKILTTLEDVVLFADEKRTQVETNGKSLILPGKKTIWKVVSSTFNQDQPQLIDEPVVEQDLPRAAQFSGTKGAGKSSFEHLPPTTVLQRLGLQFSNTYRTIGGQQSFYGFRVACAVLTVTLMAFLSRTQTWFFNRRGLWAGVFIPFSMAPSSGEAFTLLIYRLLGTVLALVLSILNWYLGGSVPGGIIVWFFVITLIEEFFIVSYPQYAPFWRPSIITRAIIIGFELQLRHTKIPAPPVTETQNFPIYLIGPYRLACVVIGISVAFIWTVFPNSTTTSSIMRKRLGVAMFTLAEYHSCMHSAVISWARGHHVQVTKKGKQVSSADLYMKAQTKLFSKEMNIINLIRAQARFSRFEPNIGGQFPSQHYKDIVREIDLFISYMNMVIFTASSVPLIEQPQGDAIKKIPTMGGSPSDIDAQWTAGIIDLVQAGRFVSARTTTLLCLMASSIANEQPLPPDLQLPEPFYVAGQLQKLRPELMDLKHATEAGYSVFAVIEVSNTMITQSLTRMLNSVKDLSGELSFEALISKPEADVLVKHGDTAASPHS